MKLSQWEKEDFRVYKNLLREFRDSLKMRHSWHEPDEQLVTAEIVGSTFDNAGCEGELEVVLHGGLRSHTPSYSAFRLTINLASLLALACMTDEELN